MGRMGRHSLFQRRVTNPFLVEWTSSPSGTWIASKRALANESSSTVTTSGGSVSAWMRALTASTGGGSPGEGPLSDLRVGDSEDDHAPQGVGEADSSLSQVLAGLLLGRLIDLEVKGLVLEAVRGARSARIEARDVDSAEGSSIETSFEGSATLSLTSNYSQMAAALSPCAGSRGRAAGRTWS